MSLVLYLVLTKSTFSFLRNQTSKKKKKTKGAKFYLPVFSLVLSVDKHRVMENEVCKIVSLGLFVFYLIFIPVITHFLFLMYTRILCVGLLQST